jgi:hypothetical protein
VLWKAALPGVGSATPRVWDDQIFVTSEEGEDLVLLCFDTNGRQQWKAKVGTAQKSERSGEGNGATPSPSTDGKLVARCRDSARARPASSPRALPRRA